MRFHLTTLALAGLIALTGCSSVVSLQPLVPDNLTIADARLEGAWIDADGKDTYLVQRSGTAYTITYIEKAGTAYRFDARLWKCGDALLLDLVTSGDAPFHLPVHIAVRIWLDRDTLRIAFLDTDWFKNLAAARLATQTVDGRTVLTAPTAALQAFYQAFAADERAHAEPGTLRRAGS